MSGDQPRRRVLFIEDERVLRQSYQRFFGDRFEVAFAATGTEALVLLREFRPDVIILDLRLPDASGLELLERVRARNGSLPVIVTTGHPDSERELEVRGLQCQRFLKKPLALGELAAAIDAVG